MLSLIVTRHAIQRSRQRLRWNRAALERMLERVFYAGLGGEDCGGALARYVAELPHDPEANCVRIYGEQVFIFARRDHTGTLALLTVYGLPAALRPSARRAPAPLRSRRRAALFPRYTLAA